MVSSSAAISSFVTGLTNEAYRVESVKSVCEPLQGVGPKSLGTNRLFHSGTGFLDGINDILWFPPWLLGVDLGSKLPKKCCIANRLE